MGDTLMAECNKLEEFTKSKILLVEGKDEVNLFTELLADIGLDNYVQVIKVGGTDKFAKELPILKKRSGFHKITSIGVVRDADSDPQGAFQSICSALHKAKLPEPTSPLCPKAGPPQVTAMIVPDANTSGMLESVCLNSVSNDPAMICVEQYFQCLQEKQRILAENVMPKARVGVFLASREWLEIAHFEYLQRCMNNYEQTIPMSAAVAVPKVHAFLASRYTPCLSLGIACKKSEREDRYFQFNHPAFNNIKQFLRML